VPTPTCPRCARPVAAAQARCVYCGAELPEDAVAAAAASRAALESEWAASSAAASPAAPAIPGGPARVLLVLETSGTDPAMLARALGGSAFEAAQRVRRGGPDLHRILPEPQARTEAARLRAAGVSVLEIAEDEVRGTKPLTALRGGPEPPALALETDEGTLRLASGDVILIVRGSIAREYPVSAEVRRVRLSSLEPGYRVHLHRREPSRPVEIDPADFEFAAGPAVGGAQLQIASWLDHLLPGVPRDDSFRLVIPALAPAAPPAGGPAATAAALGRPGRERRAVLDNVAQFRFHSAWRAAAFRLRAR
jgi:hypothetical protein